MNNLLSYCGLVDAKIRASDKDLPVPELIDLDVEIVEFVIEGEEVKIESTPSSTSMMCSSEMTNKITAIKVSNVTTCNKKGGWIDEYIHNFSRIVSFFLAL